MVARLGFEPRKARIVRRFNCTCVGSPKTREGTDWGQKLRPGEGTETIDGLVCRVNRDLYSIIVQKVASQVKEVKRSG